MARNKLALTGAALGMLLLILDSRSAALAAAEGVDLCIKTVIPSLFPFFLLTGYLAGGLEGSRLLARLFRSPPGCGGILLTGLLGGYPAGARAAAQEYTRGAIRKAQADRLLWFCSQPGPAFLFGILGMQLGDGRMIWLLWAVVLAAAGTVAWLLPADAGEMPHAARAAPVTLTAAMHSAILAMASVCGWVVIFSVVLAFLKRWVLWLLPEAAQILLCGLLELTNGCLMLQNVESPHLRFRLAALMVSFGGLCVMMQTFSVAGGLDKRGYVLGKLLQSCLTLLYSGMLLGDFWTAVPIFCIFLLRKCFPLKKGVAILPKLVYNQLNHRKKEHCHAVSQKDRPCLRLLHLQRKAG